MRSVGAVTPDGTPQIARKAQQSGHRSQITLDEPYLDDYAGHSGMQDADFGFGYDNIGLGENEPVRPFSSSLSSSRIDDLTLGL